MDYIHSIQYYETDKMGITHHSNYIRWMEEARIDFLSRNGWDYAKLEEMGIVSPVLGVSCDFKVSTTFPDKIYISVSVEDFKGVKLHLQYEMKNESGATVCTGKSVHAFLDRSGKPVKMKQEFPELYKMLSELAGH